MKITIDKAGRIVVPKPLRDRLGMTPGTELVVEADGERPRGRRAARLPAIAVVQRKGFHPTGVEPRLDRDPLTATGADRGGRSPDRR